MAHLTLMERKFYSMLLSGTMGTAIVNVAVMSTTLIAGIMIGETAVMAVTLVAPLYSLGAFFSYIVSVGLLVLYSEAMGRMDQKEADRILGFAILAALVTGVLVFASMFILDDFYLRSYHSSTEVYALAQQYLVWIRFSLLILPMTCVLNCAVYADGDTFIYNLAGFVQVGSNLLLSVLLCKWMGIGGISLGFFIALLISIVLSCLHLPKASNSLHLNLYFSWRILKLMLEYGVIDAGSHLCQSLFTAAMNYLVIRLFGEVYLVMVSAISLLGMMQKLTDGAGQGASPIMSVYLGERNYAGLRRVYRMGEKSAVLMGLIITFLILIFAFFGPSLLGVTDPEIAQEMTTGLRIAGMGTLFVSMVHWVTSYYLVIGHLRRGLLLIAMKDLLILLPVTFLLTIPLGFWALFIGYAITAGIVWGVDLIYGRRRYPDDPKTCLSSREGERRSWIYSLDIVEKDIVRVRDEAGADLNATGIRKKDINRVMLLIEELFMMIREKNPGRVVQGECAVLVEPRKSAKTPETAEPHKRKMHIEVIARDEGIHVDLTSPDMDVTSLRAYLVSSISENMAYQRQNLKAIGFNRNRFAIEGKTR